MNYDIVLRLDSSSTVAKITIHSPTILPSYEKRETLLNVGSVDF